MTNPARIDARFENLRAASKPALITFITAGDPAIEATVPYMHALVKGGADIIELGVPFSDPMADGPVIQRASERALEHGTSLSDVIDAVKAFRETDNDTPVVLMGYQNPIERMGAEKFAAVAESTGVDGVLIVDLPPEEAEEMGEILSRHHLNQIYLIAPTSSKDRLQAICSRGSGFVYYVSVKGVTGGRQIDTSSLRESIDETRALTKVPIGVGFGIRTPSAAAQVAEVADAVIIGSAIVERLEQAASVAAATDDLTAYIAEFRHAIDERENA
ncbi:MAG: tryptophan synthase subunit alpha [Pseudomonadota bacterium]